MAIPSRGIPMRSSSVDRLAVRRNCAVARQVVENNNEDCPIAQQAPEHKTGPRYSSSSAARTTLPRGVLLYITREIED